jgi:quercetin dioxygenase-like cupin family protein
MSDQLMHDLGLMLMYLSSWTERRGDAPRFWKGFDFELLDQLADEGLITDSRRAKSAYLTEDGVRRARQLLADHGAGEQAGDKATPQPWEAQPDQSPLRPGEAQPAIVRLSAGADQQSHFEDVVVQFEPRGDQSEVAEVIPGSGILVRRFEADRTNTWHHAPGRYAVFTLRGAVDITTGDGTRRRIGPGDVLLAEDLSGQGHQTREVGPEARVSVFVPLK